MEDEILNGPVIHRKSTGLVKTKPKRWAALYKRSMHGLPRLDLFDSKDSFDKRDRSGKKHTVSLEKCANITTDQTNDGKKTEYLIRINFMDEKQQILSFDAQDDREKWCAAISSVVFKVNSGTEHMSDEVVFDVQIKQTDVTDKLDLHGSYFLAVSAENIHLLDKSTRKVIIRWPLHYLRKYGRDKQEFSLEAGRRCPSGPGMFYFITNDYNAIFKEVENNVKSLASSRGRAASTSSLSNQAKGYPVMPHAQSPDPIRPASPRHFSPDTNVYADPLDARREKTPSHSTADDNYMYNEPVNKQPPPTSSRSLIIRDGKKKPKGASKFEKPVEGPKKPPRQINPMVSEATYSEALSFPNTNGKKIGEDLASEYSHLNIGGMNNEADYDSLSHCDQWSTGAPGQDATYATTGDFSRYDGNPAEDAVYDHVQRN
ncbi:docking protein 1-like [Clavelina lepadiformis]|uniref:docking protein 1-like n=1 Tax=Clavelina lepadiformis TaxID=159417 RepID=UPI004042E4AB